MFCQLLSLQIKIKHQWFCNRGISPLVPHPGLDAKNYMPSTYLRETVSETEFHESENSTDVAFVKGNNFSEVLTLNPSLVQNKQEFVKILPIGPVNYFECQNSAKNNQTATEKLEENSSSVSIYHSPSKRILDRNIKINSLYETSDLNSEHELYFIPNDEIEADKGDLNSKPKHEWSHQNLCKIRDSWNEGSLMIDFCQVKKYYINIF